MRLRAPPAVIMGACFLSLAALGTRRLLPEALAYRILLPSPSRGQATKRGAPSTKARISSLPGGVTRGFSTAAAAVPPGHRHSRSRAPSMRAARARDEPESAAASRQCGVLRKKSESRSGSRSEQFSRPPTVDRRRVLTNSSGCDTATTTATAAAGSATRTGRDGERAVGGRVAVGEDDAEWRVNYVTAGETEEKRRTSEAVPSVMQSLSNVGSIRVQQQQSQ